MSRFFSFGCSFTNYIWPTWADIAGRQFDEHYNWGQMGGGNPFIFYSLNEAIRRQSIMSDDTVIIMWTSISREDRWLRNKRWLTLGSIYGHLAQDHYGKDFVSKNADPTGYLIRDLALMSAAKLILEKIGCHWRFFSIVPFALHDDHDTDAACHFDPDSEVIALYSDVIESIASSVFEVVFGGDWYSRNGQVKINNLENRYNVCRGPDWPSWQEFLIHRTERCSPAISDEIRNRFKFERELIRTDPHPTPSEHAEYLAKIWPDLIIDFSWVEKMNNVVLMDQSLDSEWISKSVRRF